MVKLVKVLNWQKNIVLPPTLLFVDYTGKVVVATAGYHKSDEFIELGKTTTQH